MTDTHERRPVDSTCAHERFLYDDCAGCQKNAVTIVRELQDQLAQAQRERDEARALERATSRDCDAMGSRLRQEGLAHGKWKRWYRDRTARGFDKVRTILKRQGAIIKERTADRDSALRTQHELAAKLAVAEETAGAALLARNEAVTMRDRAVQHGHEQGAYYVKVLVEREQQLSASQERERVMRRAASRLCRAINNDGENMIDAETTHALCALRLLLADAPAPPAPEQAPPPTAGQGLTAEECDYAARVLGDVKDHAASPARLKPIIAKLRVLASPEPAPEPEPAGEKR